MALDMQSEFYKIAKNITGNPKNFHKLIAITPDTGRISMMGADGGVIISSGMLSALVKARPEKAYRYGRRIGKDMFGALVREFDEELERMDPPKLLELAYGLARATGWGDFEQRSVNVKRMELTVAVGRSLEAGFKEKGGYLLTAGYLAGLASVAFRTDLECKFLKISEGKPVFSVLNEVH